MMTFAIIERPAGQLSALRLRYVEARSIIEAQELAEQIFPEAISDPRLGLDIARDAYSGSLMYYCQFLGEWLPSGGA
jgi:hypothetical protein